MTKLLIRLKRSLTARLLVVFLATSALLSITLIVFFAHAFTSQWRFNARPHLEQYLDFIRAEIGNPPNIEKAEELAERLPVDIYIVGPDDSYSTNGKQLDIDENTFFSPGSRHFKRRHFGEAKIEFSGDEDRTLLRSIVGDYQVYYELAHRRDAKHRRSLFTPALLCALGVLGICFLIIRRMLRPVRDIKYGVKQMGQGDLAYRVPVRHNNDLGELAGSINAMAIDIEQMLDAKRQLLLGASHELRSPLTRAKVALQLLDESKPRSSIEDDLNEMEHLISNILESERIKTGHAALQRSTFDLKKLVQSVIDELQANPVVIECREALPDIVADETRLRILLRNLIGNAIEHSESIDVTDDNINADELNADEPPVVIKLEHIDGNLKISVIDSGPGIDAEHIERVTEPFYRTDASRARVTGGFGLGLHLAKLIAEAHGGDLTISSQTNRSPNTGEPSTIQHTNHSRSGTSVLVEIPITHGSSD